MKNIPENRVFFRIKKFQKSSILHDQKDPTNREFFTIRHIQKIEHSSRSQISKKSSILHDQKDPKIENSSWSKISQNRVFFMKKYPKISFLYDENIQKLAFFIIKNMSILRENICEITCSSSLLERFYVLSRGKPSWVRRRKILCISDWSFVVFTPS